jgi:spore maturation protein SpmB
MMLNIAANLVGAGNAATPFGLRAMTELENLNPRPGTATNAMCTFLVLNTSALTLISTTALLLLKSYGSTYPSAVIGPSILATAAGLAVGLVLVKLCQRLPVFAVEPVESSADVSAPAPPESEPATVATEPPRLAPWKWSVLGAYGVVMAIAFGFLLRQSEATSTGPLQNFLSALSPMVLPGFAGFFVLYAALAGVKVFEDFVEGAKDGMQTVLRIIPYLVGMIVVIGVLRASGVIDMMTNSLRAPLQAVGVPAELLPMALMRPLSGSGSQAVLKDILKNFGADSLISRTAATMYGSSETTFYVLALYFGSVGIRRTRHAVLAGLGADAMAMATSIFLCRVMFGK